MPGVEARRAPGGVGAQDHADATRILTAFSGRRILESG